MYMRGSELCVRHDCKWDIRAGSVCQSTWNLFLGKNNQHTVPVKPKIDLDARKVRAPKLKHWVWRLTPVNFDGFPRLKLLGSSYFWASLVVCRSLVLVSFVVQRFLVCLWVVCRLRIWVSFAIKRHGLIIARQYGHTHTQDKTQSIWRIGIDPVHMTNRNLSSPRAVASFFELQNAKFVRKLHLRTAVALHAGWSDCTCVILRLSWTNKVLSV